LSAPVRESGEIVGRRSGQPLLVPATTFVALFALAGTFGYFHLYRSFEPYDDEGYMMRTVQGTLDGQPLYDEVVSPYGPVYYLYEWFVHRPCGLPVTNDVRTAVAETKAGKVEYRVDKTGVVHVGIGKVSFDDQKLRENAQMLLDAVVKAKPSTAKGKYVKKVNLAATMSPGVLLDETAYAK